ncbi:MAG TPA: PilZ domain-containing protein [Kofleriaceae bacterium]|nr:PilZ domain-containing protein [Kofleriaceae bacterium]
MGQLQARSEDRPRRIDVRVPVEILCSRGIKLCGKTLNVSTGGMFVETGLLLPVGSPVRVDVALEQREIELIGRVAWSRQKGPSAEHTPGMGIQIVGWEADARQVLDRVIDDAPDDDDDEPYEAVVMTAVEPYDSVQITAPMRMEAVPQVVEDEVTERTNFHDVRTPQRVAMGVVFMSISAVAAAIVLTMLPAGSSGRKGKDAAKPVALATQAPAPATPIDEPAPPPAEAEPVIEPTTLDEPAQIREEMVVLPRADGTTVVVVPLDGEPAALKHYPLANPTGIAVRVDGASTAVTRGVFRQEQGGTHKVWLPANGHEVRIFTRGALPPYTAEVRGRELRVTLEPVTSVSR